MKGGNDIHVDDWVLVHCVSANWSVSLKSLFDRTFIRHSLETIKGFLRDLATCTTTLKTHLEGVLYSALNESRWTDVN